MRDRIVEAVTSGKWFRAAAPDVLLKMSFGREGGRDVVWLDVLDPAQVAGPGPIDHLDCSTFRVELHRSVGETPPETG